MNRARANDKTTGQIGDESDCTDYGLTIGQPVEVVGFYYSGAQLLAIFIDPSPPPAFRSVPAYFLTPEVTA